MDFQIRKVSVNYILTIAVVREQLTTLCFMLRMEYYAAFKEKRKLALYFYVFERQKEKGWEIEEEEELSSTGLPLKSPLCQAGDGNSPQVSHTGDRSTAI